MKNSVFTAILFFIGASISFVHGQTPAAATDVYKLGNRTVRVPAPDNFTDTMHLYPRIAGRLIASEAPANEVLAAHVTDAVLPIIKKGEDPDLPFYTKVSVSRRIKELDIESKDFPAIVAEVEKQAPALFDERSPFLKQIEKNVEGGLSKHWGGDVGFNLSQPKMLGYFDKGPNVFSAMMVAKVEIFQRQIPVIASMSLVHINKRLVFLYAFRIISSDNDAEILRDFTKAWTAKTIAANK